MELHSTGAKTTSETAVALPFWAFISYSHKDREWGDWLHRALETYRVPKKLVDTGIPARVYPVFRDREELATAPGLTSKIHAALRDSRNLIVICSPNAAASKWVDEEIRAFRELGRADRIFALIVGGEPYAQRPETECFPPSLRLGAAPGARTGPGSVDILAADARPEGDGRRNALLKLLAGILDVGYDTLRQRDHERQVRVRTVWVASLLALSAVLAVLAGYALVQRSQARASAAAESQQRQLAEDRRRVAEEQRAIAEDRLKVALSRQFATEALNNMRTRLDVALLLAVEATRPADTVEAKSSLVRILQSAHGLITFLHGHRGPVTQIAFSPDGSTIASGGSDAAVRLWNADGTPRSKGPLYAHVGRGSSSEPDEIRVLEFSADGSMVASGSLNGTLRLGDVKQLAPIGRELEFGATIGAFAFAPDGTRAVTGATQLMMIDPKAQKADGAPFSVQSDGLMPDIAAFSPDGRIVAGTGSTLGNEGLFLFDVATRKPIGEAIAERFPSIEVLRFSPDGRLLAAGDREGGIRVWNVESRRLLGQPLTGDGIVLALRFVGNDRLLFGRSTGSVRSWNLERWQAAAVPRQFLPAESMDFSPNGERVMIGGADGSVTMWDLRRRDPPLGRSVSTREWLDAVAISPDGTLLVTNGRTIDLESEQRTPSLEVREALQFAFSADSRILASAGETGVAIRDLQSGAVVRVPSQTSEYKWGVAAAADGRTIAFGGKTLTVWDVARKAARYPPLLTQEVYSVAISRDSSTLAAGAEDGQVRLWSLADGKPLGKPMPLGQPAWALAFSPDGALLATGGNDGALRLWSTSTQEAVGNPLAGFTNRVRSIAFSPDGKMMVAVGFRRTAIVFDVATRRPIGEPLFPDSQYDVISGAAFSPDGSLLALSERAQTLHLLDGGPAQWKIRACRIANRNLTKEEWDRYIGDPVHRATCPSISLDGQPR
jgi:WD40 repeat protein